MCRSQQPEQYGWRSLSLGKNPACLGLGSDWSEGWGREESKCEPKTTKHFEFVDNDLQELSKELCTKNTAMSTKWALKNLQAWKDVRNLKFPNYPVPENLLKTTLLPIHLPAPICSSLKHDNRQLPMQIPPWQEKTQIQETLNSHFHKLHKSGVGTTVETCWNHQQRRKQAMGQGSDGCKLFQLTA